MAHIRELEVVIQQLADQLEKAHATAAPTPSILTELQDTILKDLPYPNGEIPESHFLTPAMSP